VFAYRVPVRINTIVARSGPDRMDGMTGRHRDAYSRSRIRASVPCRIGRGPGPVARRCFPAVSKFDF